MGVTENVRFAVLASGALIYVVMMLWSTVLTYTIYKQWQLISDETQRELRRQGMPYIDGLDAEGIFPVWHYERVTRELSSRTVRTDERLATLFRRYRRARHVAWAALLSSIAMMPILVKLIS